jgi:hypothetical protein
VPTLFVTVSLALGLWVWGLTTFFVVRWAYGVLPVGVKSEEVVVNGRKVVFGKTEKTEKTEGGPEGKN